MNTGNMAPTNIIVMSLWFPPLQCKYLHSFDSAASINDIRQQHPSFDQASLLAHPLDLYPNLNNTRDRQRDRQNITQRQNRG